MGSSLVRSWAKAPIPRSLKPNYKPGKGPLTGGNLKDEFGVVARLDANRQLASSGPHPTLPHPLPHIPHLRRWWGSRVTSKAMIDGGKMVDPSTSNRV